MSTSTAPARIDVSGSSPPVPAEPDSEWRTWDVDLPAVVAAIESLTKSLELADRSSGARPHWRHHADDLDLWVDITAIQRDRSTTVGMSIRSATGSHARRWSRVRDFAAVAVLATAAPTLLALLFASGGDTRVLLIIGLIDVVFMSSLVVGLVVLPARRVALAQDEWSRTWRRTFWAALDARLSQRALYR